MFKLKATLPMSQLESLKVSPETLRKIALNIDQYRLMRARFGRQTANLKRKPRTAGVITTRPLERVEMDHFLCDVHLVCGRTGSPLGRPWLTVAIDHYSGACVGYYLSFAPPSTPSLLGALRHAILPKHPLAPLPPGEPNTPALHADNAARHPWLAYGIPDCIVVDNGLDLTSKGFQDACNALGTELIYTPTRSPWFKGTVERFGRTTNDRFVHWLLGTTFGKPMKEMGYDAKKEAVLTFDVFRSLFEQYITEIYNQAPVRTKGRTPDSRWLTGVLEWPVRLPESHEDFDAAVALTANAKLQQNGITYLGLQYQNAALGDLWNRVPKATSVTFKVDPLNLKTIKVLKPATQEILSVDSDIEFPLTLTFHMAVRQHARKAGRDLTNMRELELAKRDLLLDIEQATADGKRALRRMQAEMLRQSQLAEEVPTDTHEAANAEVKHQELNDLFERSFQ